jgi:hypothetical protein
MAGIVSIGASVPRYRLSGDEIGRLGKCSSSALTT